ncbi:CDP-glycerol glycerophosphotransferase family protein [Niallia circulans]|uniref:CDP-glycerol glycerophosphotransferase family protein n=1 Tax=Niallia circulans TaxID=1397 RepID=UPI0026EE097B|nr:CDP-glycerol glycerophosphotransferase family protein [Niallia circulans]
MVRELAIYLYLKLFSFLFEIAKLFPLQKKIVFCVSFVENTTHLYDELKKNNPNIPCILLADYKTYRFFNDKMITDPVLLFSPKYPLSFLKGIFHLATSQVIVLDNYYGFLSSVSFKENVKKLQIWHANGAIKTFGWNDLSVKDRSKNAKERFAAVYKQFDYIISGSDKMSAIFCEAFSASSQQILNTGIPRTDIFFDKDHMEKIKTSFYKKYPNLKNKKIILYAPTFRENEEESSNKIRLDFSYLKDRLESDYIFLVRLHPSITNQMDFSEYNGFVYNFSDYPILNDLLFITDILITDYSSIPFEFSFLQKPMIFYPYDLDEYRKTRGFWVPYHELVPGPIAYSTEEIVQFIHHSSFQMEKIANFHQEWNTYSIGNSSKNVVQTINSWLTKQ